MLNIEYEIKNSEAEALKIYSYKDDAIFGFFQTVIFDFILEALVLEAFESVIEAYGTRYQTRKVYNTELYRGKVKRIGPDRTSDIG